MAELLAMYPRELLAFLVLLARIGDVGSTYFATPTLRLEANPIARRLGWPFAFATLTPAAVPFIPNVGIPSAVIILVVSLLVASSNLRSGWFMRALGEDRYAEVLGEVLSRTPWWSSLLRTVASASCVAIVGWLLLSFCPDPQGWAWCFALGLIGYAAALVLHQSLFLRRAYSRLRAGKPAA